MIDEDILIEAAKKAAKLAGPPPEENIIFAPIIIDDKTLDEWAEYDTQQMHDLLSNFEAFDVLVKALRQEREENKALMEAGKICSTWAQVDGDDFLESEGFDKACDELRKAQAIFEKV